MFPLPFNPWEAFGAALQNAGGQMAPGGGRPMRPGSPGPGGRVTRPRPGADEASHKDAGAKDGAKDAPAAPAAPAPAPHALPPWAKPTGIAVGAVAIGALVLRKLLK